MPRLLLPLTLTVLLAAIGCQSEEEAYRMMCQAPVDCETCQLGTPAERAQRLTEYIGERLRHPEAREAFRAVSEVDSARRPPDLRIRARELGIVECPMFESVVIELEEPLALPTGATEPEGP